MFNLILKIVFIISVCICYLMICSDKNCKMTLKYHVMAQEFIFTDIIQFKRLRV
jgi:hypothetical protein